MLGIAAVAAAVKMSLTCPSCDAAGTAAATGMAIAACGIGAAAAGARATSPVRQLVVPCVLAALLAGQFFLLISDTRVCWPCTAFLFLVSLLGGAMPAAVRELSMPLPKLAGPLPVGVLVGASLAVWAP